MSEVVSPDQMCRLLLRQIAVDFREQFASGAGDDGLVIVLSRYFREIANCIDRVLEPFPDDAALYDRLCEE